MKEVLKDLEIDTKKTKERVFINAISAAKNELISPMKYEEQALGDYNKQKIARVYTEYQKRLQINNALDFDDLLMKTVELFRECPEVLARYQRRFHYIMVDEYQDTNHAQFELLHLLARRVTDYGLEHNLCVVGDDDQSIYRFRGADIRNILEFENEYPDTTVIRLEQNYRSTKAILNVANEVIHNNNYRKEKSLWTENPDGNPVKLVLYETDLDEAAGIIGDIEQKYNSGEALSNFAVLYRTNAQSRVLEEQLVRKNLNYKLIGGVNFYSRMEVKDILSYLKTIENGQDSVAVKRILNVPKRGIGATTMDKISEYANAHSISFYEALRNIDLVVTINQKTKDKISSFVGMIEGLKNKALNEKCTVRELIEELIEVISYHDYLSDIADNEDEIADRTSNINELITKAADFEEIYEISGAEESPLSTFLSEVALVADIDSLEDQQASVTLMTIHSAKGLEFPNVYLCGMEEGVFPGYVTLASEHPDEEIEEERRLCYVGITRAMRELTLSAASQRMVRGERQYNKQSRFLEEIPRHLLTIKKNGATSHRFISENKYPDSLRREKLSTSDYDSDSYSSWGSKRYGSFDDDIFDKPKPGYQPKTTPDFGRTVNTSLPPKKQFGSASSSSLGYEVGDTVHHMKFGEGVVKDITAGGKDFEVTVDFPKFGVRKLLASFARLKKI